MGSAPTRRTTASDRLRCPRFLKIRQARLFVYGSKWLVHRFREGRFTAVKPPLPSRIVDESWRLYRGILKDRGGEWWIATGEGLYRFPRVAAFDQLAGVGF